MTVDYDSRSPRGRSGENAPDKQTGSSAKKKHQLVEHSFGSHTFDQSDIEEAVRGLKVSPGKTEHTGTPEQLRNEEYVYTTGYEDRIQSIADAISVELSDVRDDGVENTTTVPSSKKDVLPENVQEELQALLTAACKVGDVIRHFHDVANRTNLFALKVTSDAMRSESGGTELALRVKDLADETYISAEKIYGCMYSIQQSIVSIADNRFEEFKHLPVDREAFKNTALKADGAADKTLEAISPKTLSSLVDELNRLKDTSDAGNHYNELGHFADQLNSEIEQLKKQLRAS